MLDVFDVSVSHGVDMRSKSAWVWSVDTKD